ncbi:uncharacterized protein [Miscanthus floridulus]|uniref:uncharacterized protein isoform X2 n=1 Tax=Miscanthus floridulus TaxID=154761 RepID=UPI0034585A22
MTLLRNRGFELPSKVIMKVFPRELELMRILGRVCYRQDMTSVMANYLKVKVKGALDLRKQSLSDLQDKVTSLEGEVAQLREDKAGLERSLKDKESENQAVLQLLSKDYEAACRDKTSLEKELEKMRDAAIAKSTDLSKNLGEKVLELNYLNDEKTKLEGQVRDKEDVIEGLRAQVAKETTASFDLKSQVQFLEDKMEATKAQGLEASTLYCQMLQRFGGLGGGPSDSASVEDLFAWMKSEFAELPDFIGKVGDFGTLSGVTNLLSTMEKFGCGHLQEFLKKSYVFPSPNELGEPSRTEYCPAMVLLGVLGFARERSCPKSCRGSPHPFSCLFCGRNSYPIRLCFR